MRSLEHTQIAYDQLRLRQEFLSLFSRRDSYICKLPAQEEWRTWRDLKDYQILAVIDDGGRGLLRGCHWDKHTTYAVLDIDTTSQYYSSEKLSEITSLLQSVGLEVNLHRSSENGGWHLYIPFNRKQNSKEVFVTLKAWFQKLGFEIKGGQLEIFPSNQALRLPLQQGFAWLNPDGTLFCARKQLSTDQALALFLSGMENKASDWAQAKLHIDAQVTAIDNASRAAQEQQERLDIDGFSDLFGSGLIPEMYEKGRKYWHTGLTGRKQRHEAILCIGHYLWYGDESIGLSSYAGDKYDQTRYRMILRWLQMNHNGFCRHINRGKWRAIENEIKKATAWRKRERVPYLQTERAARRLWSCARKTKRMWTMKDFETANDRREEEARQKIQAAVKLLSAQTRHIGCRQLMRLTGCSYHTIQKHSDIWKVFKSSGVAGDCSSVVGCSTPDREGPKLTLVSKRPPKTPDRRPLPLATSFGAKRNAHSVSPDKSPKLVTKSFLADLPVSFRHTFELHFPFACSKNFKQNFFPVLIRPPPAR